MPKLKEVKTLESFNQILSDGQKQHVVNTLSNLRVYQLNTFPHHIHPNNTLYIKNASDDDFVPSLRLRSMAPFPLHLVTDVNEFVQHNIVLKLVQQKNQYITDIAKLTGNFKRSHSKHFCNSIFVQTTISNQNFLRFFFRTSKGQNL